MIEPTMPERAYGRTTCQTVSQRVAPSASAASRCDCGTASRTSREIADDEGDDHDREQHAGGEQADAVDRAREERNAAEAAELTPPPSVRTMGTRTKMPTRP